VDGFSLRSKVVARLEVPKDLPRLARDLEISIFRIVQESLTNIHKHAEAKSVVISVSRMQGSVTLQVVDDGKGLPGNLVYGVGLRGMEERVRQLRGSFQINSNSHGTTVAATLPITEAREEPVTTH
jgi:signal transduction histidine kinase